MKEIYRKRGAAVRWENGTLVRIAECGVATEDGELFECRPDEGPAPPPVDDSEVRAVARRISAIVDPLLVERLIVSEGSAVHEFGKTRWSDRLRRVHLSLVRGRLRALLQLGDFELDDIERLANAMRRTIETEREAPARLRVAPPVTAALLPSLAGLAPPNVELWQSSGAIDGKGREVVETRIAHEPWPAWYRPTYRMRPVRMPFDLRLECDVTEIETDRPLAVALLAPPDGLKLRVLVDDGQVAYPCSVRITRIDSVAAARTWYPFGAGSFGAEMML